MHRIRPALTLILLAAALPSSVRAQDDREPGSELTVYLATMGQGDAVWEKFGHNAIWIRDDLTRSTIAYNYGIFDFNQERFIPRLLKGDMLYQMGVSDADRELGGYTYFNRSVTLQRLELSPAQRHALREYLEWNWLPQNRHYRYDYFLDNCSTRIRDALDRALGGAINDALVGVATGTTYRWHSLRLTAASPATHAGIMLGLGLPTDEPIDAWEETFIPMELARHVRDIDVVTESGDTVPLVAEETVLFAADRDPPAVAPPNRVVQYLIIGLVIAVLLLVLARRARTRRFARAGLGLAIFFWGVVTGFFGVLLASLWLLTDHSATYPNMNLFQVNPLGLVLAAAAPFTVIGSRASRIARIGWTVAVAILALSVIGVLLQAIPSLRQVNGPVIALVLPVNVAVVVALYPFRSSSTSSGADAVAPIEAGAVA